MFTDLLYQPRRELEAVRAQCAEQEARVAKLESMLVKCATQEARIAKLESMLVKYATQEALRGQSSAQEARIAKLESMLVKCAADRPLSIAALSSMGFTLSDVKANGYSLRNITTAVEPSLIYVASMGYPIKEMRYAFTVKDFKDAGFTFQALKDGGQELMCGRPDGWPYLSEADFNLL